MSKELLKTAYFPRNTSVIEDAAAKVITMVVSDGLSLKDATRQIIKIAEFNKQEIFGLLCMLQNYGMVHNSDPKNLFAGIVGEELGEDVVQVHQGTVYYAKNNNKIKTSNINKNIKLFASVEKLRSIGMSDKDIVDINPELEEVVSVMNETDNIILAEVEDNKKQEMPEISESISDVEIFKNSFASLEKQSEADLYQIPIYQKILSQAIEVYKKRGGDLERIYRGLAGENHPINFSSPKVISFIKQFIPEYTNIGRYASVKVAEVLSEKPIEELDDAFGIQVSAMLKKAQQEVPEMVEAPVEEQSAQIPEVSEGQDTSLPEIEEGTVSAEITPSPEELRQMALEGPEWKIENYLSMEKALNYFEELKKQLEAVVFNINLKLSEQDVAKYDEIRNSIDAQINKINEAQKGKEKIEKKEEKLKQEVEPQQNQPQQIQPEQEIKSPEIQENI
jgi:hypothetical protein